MRDLLSTSETVTSGDRDATRPPVRDQADHALLKATNSANSGEAGK